MDKVLIYWDNSNIFISAKEVAAEREGEPARTRVRIHFRNLLTLAHANRPVARAFAVGSIPPEMRAVWNRLENEGVEVQLLERGSIGGGEQGVDAALQVAMLEDALDHNGDPGIAVLLTGDGSGFALGARVPRQPGPDAPAGLAHRGDLVAPQLQPGDARVGRGQRPVHRAR